MSVRAGGVLKYALLPGILPRAKDFFSSGFSHVALYVAQVYRAARLLPPNHPYLNAANTGKFGIRHVLAEARKSLVFSRDHIDQIIVYYAVFLGLVLLFFQIALFLAAFFVRGAFAASAEPSFWRLLFVREGTDKDIAYRLIDYVFGLPGIFNLPADGSQAQGLPTPFHHGLHALFEFYNYGLLGVGLIIFLYLVVTVVAETAQTGTPFGQRFNHAWVPVRLILALGLLAPVLTGVNGAQYITLHAAKWGSNVASNGWERFTLHAKKGGLSLLGDPESLVVSPNPPQFNTLLEMMFLANVCAKAEEYMRDPAAQIKAYQVTQKDSWEAAPDFATALGRAEAEGYDIILRFGERLYTRNDRGEDVPVYANEKGGVKPTCGEIVIEVKSLGGSEGAKRLQEEYYRTILKIWKDGPNIYYAKNLARKILPIDDKDVWAPIPDTSYLQDTIEYFNDDVVRAIALARQDQINDPKWLEDMTSFGWGGAAIWYNRIAELNGRMVASAFNLPTASKYPDVMEYVREQRRKHENFAAGPERFSPHLSGDRKMEWRNAAEENIAVLLYQSQTLWQNQFVASSDSPILDVIRALFGLQGLYNLTDNVGVHPLAQLTGVGAALIESAVKNLGYAAGSGVLGGVMNMMSKTTAQALFGVSGFFVKIAMVGMAMGFILYYVIPFLPFMYFFFAVGGWVKGLFEAMVGLPLWALAHIRIDGQGLGGQAAVNGYFLIFEIFIRPLLIVFGLLASILIFAASVQVLHEIWPVAVTNLVGSDMNLEKVAPTGATGSPEFVVDVAGQFFFSIIYTIIVYMIGMSSFKLIDAIPNSIMRWMGSSAAAFADDVGDPSGETVRMLYTGTNYLMSRVEGGMAGLFGRWA